MAYGDELVSPEEIRKNIQSYSSLHEHSVTIFTPLWEEAFENARLRRTEHFSTSERAAIEAQGRVPYSIPVIEPRMNNMQSQQMLSRSEWRVLGREPNDEVGAEVLTQLMKSIDAKNDFQYIESDIYYDGMIKNVGIVKRYYETDESGLGDEIKLERRQFNQVMWDLNCKTFDIPRKAKWMQEWDFYTQEELVAMYPDKAEEIKRCGDSSIYTNITNDDKKYYNWSLVWGIESRDQKLLKVVCHYQRKFESQIIEFEGESKTIVNEYITCCEFLKDSREPLKEYRIDSNLFPLHPFFPSFDDGFFWGIYNQVKWAQIWIDRMSIQIDYSIGTLLKNSYEIEWNRLHPEDQARWIKIDENGNNIGLSTQATKGGAVFRRIGSSRIIDPILTANIPPDLFNVWQYMMKVIEDNLGGRNPLGLKESANESGVAVQHRQEAALASAYMFIDNLRRWKKSLGEGIVEMIKETYTDTKVFRVLGSDMSSRVLKLLKAQGLASQEQGGTGSQFFLKYVPNPELKYDLIVDRAEYSPTGKQKKYLMLQAYSNLRVQSGKPPLPFKIIGKYIPDMDMTVYDEIVEFELAEQQQMEQQRALQAQQLLFKGNLEQAKETREGIEVGLKQYNELQSNGIS